MRKKQIRTQEIMTSKTTTGVGTAFELVGEKRTFHVEGLTSAGTGAATVDIEFSNTNDTDTFITGATVTLALTTTNSGDGVTTDAPWRYARANVTSISGTDAEVTVTVGTEE